MHVLPSILANARTPRCITTWTSICKQLTEMALLVASVFTLPRMWARVAHAYHCRTCVFKAVLTFGFCTIFASLAFAGGNQTLQRTDPTIVFLTTGQQILKLNITLDANGVATNARVVATYSARNFAPEDLTVGPDNKIYVCSPTTHEIRRMNQDFSGVQTVYSGGRTGIAFDGPKFDAFGDLLVNSRGTSSGVWIFRGIASSATPPSPSPLVNFSETGEGLAFANDGRLYIVNQGTFGGQDGTVSTVPMSCYASSGCSLSTPISSLRTPTGIARDNFDNIYVAETSGGTISKFNPNGTFAGSYFTFASPDQPLYAKFAADGVLLVATSQPGTTGTETQMQNGKLYLVPPGGGSATLLFSVPPPNATKPAPPAIGVAMGATNATIKASPFASNLPNTGSELIANFGHDGVELTQLANTTCNLAITTTQKTPAAVNAALAATVGPNFTAVQEAGQEGWTNTFALPADLLQQCGSILSPAFYRIYLASLPASSTGSVQVISCDLDRNTDGNIIPVSGALPSKLTCQPTTFFGVYPFGLLPTDYIGGGGRTSSEFILANQSIPSNDQFCGFGSPLAGSTLSQPYVKQGNTSGVPVKVRYGTCPNGPFDTGSDLVITISAQQLTDGTGAAVNFSPLVVTPQGSSNQEAPPILRLDTNTGTWIFNLNFQWPDGTNWAPGEYAITVQANKESGFHTAYVLIR